MPKSKRESSIELEAESELNQSSSDPLNLENRLWKGVMRHCSYIHRMNTLLYLRSHFRVAYVANISEHLTIRWDMDHRTGNYFTYSFWTLRNCLWCEGSLAFEQALRAFLHSGANCNTCKMKQRNGDVQKLFATHACLHVLYYVSVLVFFLL